LKWKFLFQTGGWVYSSPAIDSDGTVYIGFDDDLYAVKSDGTLKWKYQTGYKVNSSPAIGSDGIVYVGSEDNYLYAVKSDGTLKWKYQTGGGVHSSPAIGSDGTVYVGSTDNYLYAVTSYGTLKWQFQTGTGGYQVWSSPAIGFDGTVYIGSDDLYAVKSDGTLKWKYQTGGQVNSSPAIGSDGTVYVGSWDTYLYALKSDGTLKWKFQTGNQVKSSPAIGSDGTVYVGSFDTYLYAFAPEKTIVEISPPSNVRISDIPNDNGHQLRITWNASPSESDGHVDWYKIYRSRSSILTDPIPLSRFSTLDSLIFYEQRYTILIDSVAAGKTEYIDKIVPMNGVPYSYWLQAVWQNSGSQKVAAGNITLVEDEPREFHVSDPYPNPFNPYTTIRYQIPTDCHVELIIYDALGRKVALLQNGKVSAGVHEAVWNGKNDNGIAVGSGVYLYRLKAGKNIKQGKMLLMK
jgi:outer membrane protein assembly factor BamB